MNFHKIEVFFPLFNTSTINLGVRIISTFFDNFYTFYRRLFNSYSKVSNKMGNERGEGVGGWKKLKILIARERGEVGF